MPALRLARGHRLAWVLAMAFVFANVEVQVEGDAGWVDALILLVRRLSR